MYMRLFSFLIPNTDIREDRWRYYKIYCILLLICIGDNQSC